MAAFLKTNWYGVNPKFRPTDIRYFCTKNPSRNTDLQESNLLSLSYGEIVRKDINSVEGLVPENYSTYQVVNEGDIVVRLLDLQNDHRSLRSGLVRETGIITSAYVGLNVQRNRANSRFVSYSFRAMDQSKFLYALGAGVRQTLKTDEFLDIKVPLPDLDTQRRIADYLDKETAQIDTLVAELDGYVELLEKRKHLVIVNETGITDKSCPKTQLGWHASVVLGKTKQSTQKSKEEALLKYVRAGNIQPNGVFEGEEKSMWFSPSEAEQYSLRKGDVLVVEGGAGFGRSLTLHSDLDDWGFQNHVIRIRPDKDWDSQYLDYVVRAYKAIGYIDLLAVGATIPGFSAEKAKKLGVPFAPLEKQEEIAQHITQELTRTDTIITQCRELKELLLKRRQVLITDVVTGKVEV
ncbi:restriction endonuclease subunit S [Corynebacterium camporealensis]